MKKIITLIMAMFISVLAYASTPEEDCKAIEANIKAQTIDITRDTVIPSDYGELFADDRLSAINMDVLKVITKDFAEKCPTFRISPKAEILEIVGDDKEATAKVKITTVCTPKSDMFVDNIVHCTMTFKKINGKWKMAHNQIESIKYIH